MSDFCIGERSGVPNFGLNQTVCPAAPLGLPQSQSMSNLIVQNLQVYHLPSYIKICKKNKQNKQNKHICSVRQAAWHRQSWQLEFQSLPDRHITTVKCTPGLLCLCSAASLPALLLCPSAALTAHSSSLSASPAGRLPPSAA